MAVERDLTIEAPVQEAPAEIVVSGSSGLVGRAVVAALTRSGYRVRSLVRRPVQDPSEIYWDPAAGALDPADLEGCHGLVHLAGEPIDGRWTAGKKDRIRNSRVAGTRLLSTALASLQQPPRVWVSASAVGFYGDRGDEILHEEAPPGEGFLSDVCVAWEQAAKAPSATRLVTLRIGVVLTSKGGALGKMALPFRFGLGGRMGDGQQFVSWISLRDLVGTVQHVLGHRSLVGPVNAVAPGAVTQRQLTAALGKVLRRPTIFPVPGAVLRLVLGEMAEGLLLASARASSEKLMESGFEFLDPEIEGTLRRALGRA